MGDKNSRIIFAVFVFQYHHVQTHHKQRNVLIPNPLSVPAWNSPRLREQRRFSESIFQLCFRETSASCRRFPVPKDPLTFDRTTKAVAGKRAGDSVRQRAHGIDGAEVSKKRQTSLTSSRNSSPLRMIPEGFLKVRGFLNIDSSKRAMCTSIFVARWTAPGCTQKSKMSIDNRDAFDVVEFRKALFQVGVPLFL